MRHISERWTRAVLVFLVLIFAVFFLTPLIGLGVRAAMYGRFFEVASSEIVTDAMVLSIVTATITLAIAVLFGTPVSYLLALSRFRGRGIIEALVVLPIVMPPTVAGVALFTAFGRRGLIGGPLVDYFGITIGFSTVAVVMAQVLVAVPLYVQAAKSGFESMDEQLVHVAYTLGASRLRTFLFVSLPQASAALIAGAILSWTRALGELGATLIFAGNLQGVTQTMPLAILTSLEGAELGLGGAITQSIILLFASLSGLLFLATFHRFFGPSKR